MIDIFERRFRTAFVPIKLLFNYVSVNNDNWFFVTAHLTRYAAARAFATLLYEELGHVRNLHGNKELGLFNQFISDDCSVGLLAKTAQMAGLDICRLDFSKASENLELAERTSQYTYMGALGEGYAWFMRLLPPSYRLFQPHDVLYNGMISVSEATPIMVYSES